MPAQRSAAMDELLGIKPTPTLSPARDSQTRPAKNEVRERDGLRCHHCGLWQFGFCASVSADRVFTPAPRAASRGRSGPPYSRHVARDESRESHGALGGPAMDGRLRDSEEDGNAKPQAVSRRSLSRGRIEHEWHGRDTRVITGFQRMEGGLET